MWQNHEQLLTSDDPALLHLGFLFYYDGLGINNPIGPFHNNHNLGMCYVVVANLDPSHRVALHNIFLMTVAEKSAYENWPAGRLVYGHPTEEPDDSTSFGMTMRRMSTGISFPVPDVKSPTGFSPIVIRGGCIGVTADTPAAAWLFGYKESSGPNVQSFCRLCNARQVHTLSIPHPPFSSSFLADTHPTHHSHVNTLLGVIGDIFSDFRKLH